MFEISEKYINQRCGLHLQEYQVSINSIKGFLNSKGKFTACHDHEHITREKYNEIVPKIIDEFVNAGFYDTILFFQKEIDLNKEYNDLSKDMISPDKITAQKTTKSNEIIRKYMIHIYDVEDHNGVSIINQWNKETLERAFQLLNKPNSTTGSYISELLKKIKFNPVTIYSPIMTKSIIQELGCKTVFDPCIGWGGRMIGTTCLGEGYHYTGCEPFTKTFNGLELMINDLNLEDQVDIYHSGVETMFDVLKEKRYDMCLTSPPYYDLEVYSHEDTQSIKKYTSYEEWINHFIKPIIEFVCNYVDKYSCWSVKNIKTDKKYDLLEDVIRIHQENGWILERHYSIGKNTRNEVNAKGDTTYVFSKE